MKRNLSEDQPAKNLLASPPTRKHVQPDGTIREEKLNPMRFKRKMVHPNGNVIELGLANGWAINSFKNNDYGVQLLEEKMDAGFLPFNECPYANGAVPLPLDAKGKPKFAPCVGDFPDNPKRRGHFKRNTSCKHIKEIAARRKALHKKSAQRFTDRFETNTEKLIKAIEVQNKLLGGGEGAKSEMPK